MALRYIYSGKKSSYRSAKKSFEKLNFSRHATLCLAKVILSRNWKHLYQFFLFLLWENNPSLKLKKIKGGKK